MQEVINQTPQSEKFEMSDETFEKATAKRSVNDLPSFTHPNAAPVTSPLPCLQDSTILQINESHDEPSFINDTQAILSKIDS